MIQLFIVSAVVATMLLKPQIVESAEVPVVVARHQQSVRGEVDGISFLGLLSTETLSSSCESDRRLPR